MCGESMSYPGAVVVDAGQAFEVITIPILLLALDCLSEGLSGLASSTTAFVVHAPQFIAGFGADISKSFEDRTLFTLQLIKRCLLFRCVLDSFYLALGSRTSVLESP